MFVCKHAFRVSNGNEMELENEKKMQKRSIETKFESWIRREVRRTHTSCNISWSGKGTHKDWCTAAAATTKWITSNNVFSFGFLKYAVFFGQSKNVTIEEKKSFRYANISILIVYRFAWQVSGKTILFYWLVQIMLCIVFFLLCLLHLHSCLFYHHLYLSVLLSSIDANVSHRIYPAVDNISVDRFIHSSMAHIHTLTKNSLS